MKRYALHSAAILYVFIPAYPCAAGHKSHRMLRSLA